MKVTVDVPDYLADYVRGLGRLSGTNPTQALSELLQFTAICPMVDVQHCLYTGRYVDTMKGEGGKYIETGGLVIQPIAMKAIPNVQRLSIKASILRPSPIWYTKAW